MKKMNKKGFTLAELLIVVAIIAVLVAISIPVFTAQLHKAQAARDEANIRSEYAKAVVNYMENSTAVLTLADLDTIAENGTVAWGTGSSTVIYTHEKANATNKLSASFGVDAQVFAS